MECTPQDMDASLSADRRKETLEKKHWGVSVLKSKRATTATEKKISSYEKKIQALELENKKNLKEVTYCREERKVMLDELEESRSEVLNLSEENFALRKELEKLKSKGVQQTEQRPETSVRRPEAIMDMTDLEVLDVVPRSSDKQAEDRRSVDTKQSETMSDFDSLEDIFADTMEEDVIQENTTEEELLQENITKDTKSTGHETQTNVSNSNSILNTEYVLNEDNILNSETHLNTEHIPKTDRIPIIDGTKHTGEYSSNIESDNHWEKNIVNNSSVPIAFDTDEVQSTGSESESVGPNSPVIVKDFTPSELEQGNSDKFPTGSVKEISAYDFSVSSNFTEIKTFKRGNLDESNKKRTPIRNIFEIEFSESKEIEPVYQEPAKYPCPDRNNDLSQVNTCEESFASKAIPLEEQLLKSSDNCHPDQNENSQNTIKLKTSSRRKQVKPIRILKSVTLVKIDEAVSPLENDKSVTPEKNDSVTMETIDKYDKSITLTKNEESSPEAKKDTPKSRIKANRMTAAKTKLKKKSPSAKTIKLQPKDDTEDAGTYFCSPCNIGFASEAHFDRHINWKHSGAGLGPEWETGIPSVRVNATPQEINSVPVSKEGLENSIGLMESVDLKDNIRFMKTEKEVPKRRSANVKKHECTVCEKLFFARSTLEAHMNVHNGIRPFECSVCGVKFYSKADRNKHMKLHGTEKTFVCELCEKRFAMKSYLDHHMASHRQERKFQCELCTKRFIQKTHLQKHVQIIHKKEKKYVCDQCQRAFSTSYSLSLHVNTHLGMKPFNCDTCGKSFANKNYLQKHQMYHTGEKRYMCITCKKMFYQSTDLQRHMRLHNNIRPYSCTKCDYTSTLKEHMKSHERIHLGIKFQCDFCERKYSTNSALSRHRKKDHEKRLLVCS